MKSEAICASLNFPKSTYYRLLKPPKTKPAIQSRKRSHRALSEVERCEVLDVLHEVRFIDKSPAAVYAALLDEGRYLCSIRTMYRILHSVSGVRERRRQANRTQYLKPELLATGPNEVWSWDITKLKGPEKWTYFYAYVMIDIYSRCVVGWLVATRESAELGKLWLRSLVTVKRFRSLI